MNDTRVGAILVAAGRGARMRAAEPKQFHDLGGRRLVMYALQSLSSSPRVAHVVVVVPAEWEERARAFCIEPQRRAAPVTVVAGAATRQGSVHCGLQVLPPCSHVLVHDAVRPFVTLAHIERVVDAAQRHGAATIALPLTDTLVRVAAPGDVSSAAANVQRVDRQGLWSVQTPQAFERDLLLRAHEHARDHGLQATDDGGLVVALGRRLELVEGSWWNIKVTTPEDLQRARWILQSGLHDAPGHVSSDGATDARGHSGSAQTGSSKAARERGAR